MDKILLLENEEMSAMLLSMMLAESGYEVKKASTIAEARLIISTKFIPDLLISDWRIEDEITADVFAHELSNINPEVIIIFISGMEADEIKKCSSGLNVASIFTKPADFDDVLKVVQQLFNASVN